MVLDVNRGLDEFKPHIIATSTTGRKPFVLNASYLMWLVVLIVVDYVIDPRLRHPLARFVRHR